jgi:drug/metabolite transporter (DMT)-like permease
VEAYVRRFAISGVDLGLLFVVLIWGFSPALFKFALEELQPLAFVFVRFVLLSAVSLVVLAWRGARGGQAWRIRRRDVPPLILSGLSGYGIYQLFYMLGLAHTTVFASALLVATVPLWSALILAFTRLERIHPVQWIGIAVSLAGVAWFLAAGQGHQSELAADRALTPLEMLAGNALSLGAAALFAVYGILNRGLGRRYSPPELMCYTLLVGTLALAPFGVPALLTQEWSQVTGHTWLIIAYSVFFPIYITYTIWNWAIGRRGVGYVTLFSYAVPVMSGVFGFLLLGEALTLAQLAGAAVVLGGMLAARWGVERSRLRARGVPQSEVQEAVVPPVEMPLLDSAIAAQDATSLGRAGPSRE